jgi:YidC/Oxa1 family membrane protein insertase
MDIWELIILRPVVNFLIWLSHTLFGSFGLAVIVLTIIINLILLPFTLKQMKTSKLTAEMQPKLAALQKKYGNNQQALAQEQMKLYKEAGISPTGCLLPMLIQMPIWVALYQAIMRVMAVSPESLLNLSSLVYNWDVIFKALPLKTMFLGLNMVNSNFILALLVGATMYLQTKMTSNQSSGNAQLQQQTQMMSIMMPLMFIFMSMTLPAGLSLYWIINAIIRMVMQYFYSGWGGLQPYVDKIKSLLHISNKKNNSVTKASSDNKTVSKK